MDRSKLHYVQPAPGIGIIRASEIDLDISTADTDGQGYYTQNGTNRSLACGIAEDGQLMLIMRTNGDDEALVEGAEEIRNMAQAMSDAPECDIDEGWDRLTSAIEAMRRIYANNDSFAEDIDWIEEQIEAARSEVSD